MPRSKGIIFDIEHGSFVDGPGIRTTVFFKGCNLRCAWCHNPEGQSNQIQRLVYRDKCVGCGRCKSVCLSPEGCILCGECAKACPTRAIQLCGREVTADEVLKEAMRDRAFYEMGGGVTFSGGECMLQIDFLQEILKKCKESGIHTAVDTAGCVPWSYFERILPFTDLFLYDIKAASSALHRKTTGCDNALILSNFSKLCDCGKDIIVRIPVVGGVNDNVDEIGAIAKVLEGKKLLKTELLPYHAMGENKFRAMGMPPASFSIPSKERMEQLKSLLNPYNN